jgi:transposase
VARLTKGIDSLSFIRDYREGKSYEKIAISQGCSITTVANRVRDLGLKRDRKSRELFSAEEKYIFSKMIETRGGRRQLLEILRGD